jgi:hypothetical protein
MITFYISSSFEDFARSHKKYHLPKVETMILEIEGIEYKSVFGVQQAIQKSKGRIGPGNFVMESYDGTIMYDYFDLTKWIESKGLRKI